MPIYVPIYVPGSPGANEQISITPMSDGTCVAQGSLLPLVILDAACKPSKSRRKKDGRASSETDPAWSNLCSGGALRTANNAISLGFATERMIRLAA